MALKSNLDRVRKDIAKLIESKYEVKFIEEDRIDEFYVKFIAPNESLYSGGVFKILVRISDTYPIESPIILFRTPIFHPNINDDGIVCLDVLEQGWNPSNDLCHVFGYFLPQLLSEPNEDDPLNYQAARLLKNNFKKFEETVREWIEKFATEIAYQSNKD